MRVAVTGGSGTFGSYLIPALLEAGHEPIIVSRSDGVRPDGVAVRKADVGAGTGLQEAFDSADAIVHAATNPAAASRTEVDGSQHVVDAADGRHVLYLSIVGVDNHRFPYYRAKLAGEQVIARASHHTILRATQFHDLLDWWLGLRVFPTTRDLRFQLIDAAIVAERVVRAVETGPSGRLDDIGGPRAIPIRELVEARRELVRSARLIPVPRVGFLRDFDDGHHIDLDAAVSGGKSWAEFLSERHRLG